MASGEDDLGQLDWHSAFWIITPVVEATVNPGPAAFGTELTGMAGEPSQWMLVNTYTGSMANSATTETGLVANAAFAESLNYQPAPSADAWKRRMGQAYVQGELDIPELARRMAPPGNEGDIARWLEENGLYRSLAANTLSAEERAGILAGLAAVSAAAAPGQFNTDELTRREVIASQRIESIYVNPAAETHS